MYITTYTWHRSYVRGPKAGTTVQVHTYYRTQALTPRHQKLRDTYPGSKTYGPNAQIITHFTIGMPLEKPFASGKLIATS